MSIVLILVIISIFVFILVKRTHERCMKNDPSDAVNADEKDELLLT